MYPHKDIETKWREQWKAWRIYKTPTINVGDKKKYVLEALPYPSGAGLHVGHTLNYGAGDVLSRFFRMSGYKVLHPMGWDAFGLPAENYAIKTGLHPRINTNNAIETFRKQIIDLGTDYDWDKEVGTHNPDYYKWTQWWFQLLYKRGLAYKKEALVNWDPVDQTVLANEQVLPDGTGERSGAKVEQKIMNQWFFKITDLLEDKVIETGANQGKTRKGLLNGLDDLDWPESTKIMQKNWIGKSQGAEIKFEIHGHTSSLDIGPSSQSQLDSKNFITVFTTRPDTLMGVTYLVLAPEHDLVSKLITLEQKLQIEEYVDQTKLKTQIQRTDLNKNKTGVWTGSFALHPISQELIPIFIADYVLSTYGTGAVMAVPAHDERDFEFTQNINQKIQTNQPLNLGKTVAEAIERKSVIACIFDPKSQQYLYLHWPEFNWTALVLGGVDDNEDLETALRRELAEETGFFDVKLYPLGGQVNNYYWADNKQVWRKLNGYGFLVILNTLESKEQSLEANEKFELKWGNSWDIIQKMQVRGDDKNNFDHFIEIQKRGTAKAIQLGLDKNQYFYTSTASELARLETTVTIFGNKFDEVDDFREDVRVILFDPETKKYAIQFSKKTNSYATLGGGLESSDKTLLDTVKRELIEETGYIDFKITGQLGNQVISYYDQHGVKKQRVSTGFLAILESKNRIGVTLTEQEKIEGCEVVWLSKDEAIENIKNRPDNSFERHLEIFKRGNLEVEKLKLTQTLSKPEIMEFGQKEKQEIDKESVKAIIFDPNLQKFLAINYSDGFGSTLAGGAIKPGENHREALLREIEEETGYTNILATHPLDNQIISNLSAHETTLSHRKLIWPFLVIIDSNFRIKQNTEQQEKNITLEWLESQEILDKIHKLGENGLATIEIFDRATAKITELGLQAMQVNLPQEDLNKKTKNYIRAIIYNPETNKYLFKQFSDPNEKPRFGLVGADIDFNESEIEALLRGLKQETGYDEFEIVTKLGASILSPQDPEFDNNELIRENVGYLVLLKSDNKTTTNLNINEQDKNFETVWLNYGEVEFSGYYEQNNHFLERAVAKIRTLGLDQDVVIRQAKNEDLEQILEIRKQGLVYVNTSNLEMGTDIEDVLNRDWQKVKEKFQTQFVLANHNYFVIEKNYKVIGFSNVIYEENHIELDKCYLALDFIKKGYGTKLLNFTLQHLKRLDQDILLEVVSFNETAINFYSKFGFQKTEVVLPPFTQPSGKQIPATQMILKKEDLQKVLAKDFIHTSLEFDLTKPFENREVSYCIIYNPVLNKFLVTKKDKLTEGHNFYHLVGGGVENNEDKIQALIREIGEETKLSINDFGDFKYLGKLLRGFYSNTKNSNQRYFINVFYVETNAELEGVMEENRQSIWLSKQEILDNTLPHFVWLLQNYTHILAQTSNFSEFNLLLPLEIKPVVALKYQSENKTVADLPLITRKNVLAILKHFSEDKYLCINWVGQANSWKSFVMGGVETGETWIEAGYRELREETGYTDITYIEPISGQIHSTYFAKHKNENRYSIEECYIYKLNSDTKSPDFIENLNHELVWLPKEGVSEFLSQVEGQNSNLIFWERYLNSDYCFTGQGATINSGEFDGLETSMAKQKIVEYLQSKELGNFKTTYRIRDWLVSRQRYWGSPIPIFYDKDGQESLVPENDLPVILPEDVDFHPSGRSPLIDHQAFHQSAQDLYGLGTKREVDTMDTFVCSSWYFFRYCSPKSLLNFADKKDLETWMPIDQYIIGAEHSVLHLLYARFFTKILFDEGLINFDEPFLKLRHPGLILGEDSRKMSKRWGNVINPDDVYNEFGADTLRLYEMFMGPFDEPKPWNTNTVKGVRRFLERVWKAGEVLTGTNVEAKLPTKNTIKNIILDFGGVIFEGATTRTSQFISQKLNIDFGMPQTYQVLSKARTVISKEEYNSQKLYDFIIDELGIQATGSEFYNYVTEPVINPKVANFITNNPDKNFYYLSNSNAKAADKRTNNEFILQHFKGGLTDFEIGYKYHKPDKEIYNLLLKKYDLSSFESVFIDDLVPNIEVAKELGFEVVLFNKNTDLEIEFANLANSTKPLFTPNFYPLFDRRTNAERQLPISQVRERAVALIRLKNTDIYLAFSKSHLLENDYYFDTNSLYLPGGKIEDGEDVISTAKREVLEEIGLSNLSFIKNIASTQVLLGGGGQINNGIEHYLLFEIEESELTNRVKSELEAHNGVLQKVGLSSLRQNNWPQLNWILDKLEGLNKNLEPKIITSNLVLSFINLSDQQEIFDNFTPEIAELIEVKPVENIDQTREFITQAVVENEISDNFTFTIRAYQTGEFLGVCSLQKPDEQNRRGLGIWLKNSAQQQNFGTEAVTALINWAKLNLGIQSFYWNALTTNTASSKTAAKLDFIQVPSHLADTNLTRFELTSNISSSSSKASSQPDSKLESSLQKLTQKITSDITEFKFNTAVAEFMKFINLVEDQAKSNIHLTQDQWLRFIKLLAPFAPFLTEELYSQLNLPNKLQSIHLEKWPSFDPNLVTEDVVVMAVQINGKLRGTYEMSKDLPEAKVMEIILKELNIAKWIEGKPIKFSKVIPNKIVTISV